LPKQHRNPQQVGLYDIHRLKVEISRTDLWHMMSKSRRVDVGSLDVILCNSIGDFVT